MTILCNEVEFFKDYERLFPEWPRLKKAYFKVEGISELPRIDKSNSEKSLKQSNAESRNQTFYEYQSKYRYTKPLKMTNNGPQPISEYIPEHFPQDEGWR